MAEQVILTRTLARAHAQLVARAVFSLTLKRNQTRARTRTFKYIFNPGSYSSVSLFPHSFQSFRSVSVADIAFHRRRQFRFNSRNSDSINNDDSSRSNVSNRNSNNNNSSYNNNNSSYNASLPASGRSSIRTTFDLQRSGSGNLQNHHYNNNNNDDDDEKRHYEKQRPQNGSERHLPR